MKIIELQIEGFRSFKSQTWRPGDLNVVIGPNASGKSNLLRFLEMIQASAEGKLAKFVQSEGGMGAIVWDGVAEEISTAVSTSIEPGQMNRNLSGFQYGLTISRFSNSTRYAITHEVLQGDSPDAFRHLNRDQSSAYVSSWEAHTQGESTAQSFEIGIDSCPETESLLSTVATPFSFGNTLVIYKNQITHWKIYQHFRTDRDALVRMPQVTRAETQLDPDGQNLISVLHSLYTESREFKADINQAMTAAFGDHFEELIFPPAADQRVQMRVRWQGAKHETSTADLSDGTLRFLYLLAILANPSPAPLIAIDEPETGLHPSMLPIIADYAREAATRTQVIFTTHSPDLLTAFGDDPPTTTVTEWRENETYLKVLSGDELAYWLKNYTLGELFRSNELESMP